MTLRKASAYLMCFDAPPPVNDVHPANVSVVSLMEKDSSASNDPAMAGRGQLFEAEHASEEALSPPQDIPAPEDMMAAFEEKIAAAMEDERQAAAQRLRQARQEWANETADQLASRLDEAMNGAVERLREDVAAILRPFVSREVLTRTVEALTNSVRKGLAGAINPVIEISAPADLLDKLSRALNDRDIAIIARESDQAEAAVHLGSTTIATALKAWLTQPDAGQRDE